MTYHDRYFSDMCPKFVLLITCYLRIITGVITITADLIVVCRLHIFSEQSLGYIVNNDGQQGHIQ